MAGSMIVHPLRKTYERAYVIAVMDISFSRLRIAVIWMYIYFLFGVLSTFSEFGNLLICYTVLFQYLLYGSGPSQSAPKLQTVHQHSFDG